MVSFLERYRGPRDAIDDVLDGKKSATQAVQYLSGYSHIVPYSRADMNSDALGFVECSNKWPPLVMPEAMQLVSVIKKTLTGEVNADVIARGWYSLKPWAQLGLNAGRMEPFHRSMGLVFGRTVFAGSVMSLQMALDLLGACQKSVDAAMPVDQLKMQLEIRAGVMKRFGVVQTVETAQTPVVVTALRTDEKTNDTALHVIPLRPGTCVVNDEGLVIYVYEKPMGASGPQNVFFERNANGFMTTKVVQGWIDGYQLRAGCEAHAKLFVKRGLTTPRDQSMLRSLFTRKSLAQHNR